MAEESPEPIATPFSDRAQLFELLEAEDGPPKYYPSSFRTWPVEIQQFAAEEDEPPFWLVIEDDGRGATETDPLCDSSLVTAIAVDMNMQFNTQHCTATFVFHGDAEQARPEIYLLKFETLEKLARFQLMFSKSIYESQLNSLPADERILLSSIQAHASDDQADPEGENTDDDEVLLADTAAVVTRLSAPTRFDAMADSSRNSCLLGISGASITAMRHDAESIRDVLAPVKLSFAPTNGVFTLSADQRSAMVLDQQRDMLTRYQPSVDDGIVHNLDIETGSVIRTYDGLKGAQVLRDVVPMSGLDPNQYVVVSQKCMTGLDTRIAGGLIVPYNPKVIPTEKRTLTCCATTADGAVVAGSMEGFIQCYAGVPDLVRSSGGKHPLVAKTRFQIPGRPPPPVTGIDVSRDGRWIVVTTPPILILIDAQGDRHPDKTAFDHQAVSADSKNHRMLMLGLKPEDSLVGGSRAKFTKATFSPGTVDFVSLVPELNQSMQAGKRRSWSEGGALNIVSSYGGRVYLWDVVEAVQSRCGTLYQALGTDDRGSSVEGALFSGIGSAPIISHQKGKVAMHRRVPRPRAYLHGAPAAYDVQMSRKGKRITTSPLRSK